MNCKNARHLIFAFADGQLDVRDNCELLDHLKMCPACTARVDEHQQMRATLRRSLEAIEVPAALAGRVRTSLKAPKAPARSRRILKLAPAFLAAAACIVFAFHSIADFIADGPMVPIETGRVVPRGLNAAVQVSHKHLACGSGSQIHGHMESTVNPATVGKTMSAHLGDRLLVMAPNLSQFGYFLDTAAYCGIQEGEMKQGSHLVFASSVSNVKLSFFSIPRWDCLDQCGHREVDGTGMKTYSLPQESGGVVNLVYWHQGQTSYIFCGELDAGTLSDMMRDTRLASIAAAEEVALSRHAP